MYLVVLPKFRHKGIAIKLHNATMQKLRKKGVTYVFAWANAEDGGRVVNFNKKMGFAEGHKYVWMDKKI